MKDIREKFKKISKVIVNTIIIILVVLIISSTIYTIYYNLKTDLSSFLNSSITDILALTIAIIFAYYFVERKSDERKQKEIIEKNIEKIQNYIYDDEIYYIKSKEANDSLTRRIKIRKINNLITYLADYSKKFDFDKKMDELSKNFLEYKGTTEAMSEDNDFSDKSKNNVKRIIETIDDNLEEILHKIYL